MEIEQNNTRTKGSFTIADNGVEAGRLTYSWAGIDKLIIDHTEVNPAYAHKGVGEKLVMAAVKYARDQNIKILPLCPFAKSVFKKHEEIRDVMF